MNVTHSCRPAVRDDPWDDHVSGGARTSWPPRSDDDRSACRAVRSLPALSDLLSFYKAFYVHRVAVRETVLLGKCITHMRPGSCEQQPHTGTGTRLTTGPSRTSSRSAQFAAPSPMACKRQRSATSMRDAACDAQHHHLTLTTGDPRTDREHRRTSDSHPSRVTAQAKRTRTLGAAL